MATISTRNSLITLNLSAKQIKDMTRTSGAEWPDSLVNDYLTILRNFITVSESSDSLIPKSGSGDPNEGNIEPNNSRVFYRSYLTGEVRVSEVYFSPDVAGGPTWLLISSYSQAESP